MVRSIVEVFIQKARDYIEEGRDIGTSNESSKLEGRKSQVVKNNSGQMKNSVIKSNEAS